MKQTNMKKLLTIGLIIAGSTQVQAQGIHFSQYYNAPALLNPANTALMSEHDYRVGAIYRDQWSAIPVPYQTMSAYADFTAVRDPETSNWLGVGAAFYNDKTGNGELAMTKVEAFLAYHLQLGQFSMISVGASAAYVQRTVNFDKLTYDLQWDGFTFNNTLPSGEKGGLQKTNFGDVSAGINYAFFPNENVYIKVGVGVAHLNQPKETFYGMINKVGIRPTGNVDALFKVGETFIVNPSVYYTRQKNASEIMYGSLFMIYLTGEKQSTTNLILGGFHRWNEAVVGALGIQYGGLRFMGSYDFTISQLTVANKSRGAAEFGLVFQGFYSQGGSARRTMNCPRF